MRSPRVLSFAALALVACGSPPLPELTADDFTIDEDTVLELTFSDLVGNDVDPQGRELTVSGVAAASDGAVELDGETVRYTPPADFFGMATFSYVATNGAAEATALVTVTVEPVNDPPRLAEDRVAGTEDEPLAIAATTLLENDEDIEGDEMTFVRVSAEEGEAELADGEVRYVPAPDAAGERTVTYVVSDGELEAESTLVIDLAPVDDAPRPQDDEATTLEDEPLALPFETLLANDEEVDGETLTVVAVIADVGAVELTESSATYTPPAEYSGPAVLTYTVTDGITPVEATVAVTVTEVNDPPIAGADTAETDEDTELRIPLATVLANDTDVEGSPLTVTAAASGTGGGLVLDGDELVFTPWPDFFGGVMASYTVSDGEESTDALVQITVRPINDAPRPMIDMATTVEDTAAVLLGSTLLANDVEVEGDPMTIVGVADAVNGRASVDGGDVTFTPDADFFGTARFDYEVSDGTLSAIARVIVTVTPVNDAPAPVDDSLAVDEDTVLSATVASLLANDVDVDRDTLTVTAVESPENGSVVLDGAVVRFTPDEDYNGPAAFTYRVSDGTLDAAARVAITVRPVNDAPVATDDTAATDEDVPLVLTTATLLANDADVDGDSLSIIAAGSATDGAVEITPEGVRYTPSADFHGTMTFDATVSDGRLTDDGTVTVTVRPVNDAPRPVADTVSTAEDTSVSVTTATLLANDVDVEDDPMTVTAVRRLTNGTPVLDGASVRFTPDADVFGTARFEYTVSDGELTATAEVQVTITPVPDAPVAVDDNLLSLGTGVTLPESSLTANDLDVDGDALTVTAVFSPVGGTVALSAGEVTFTPTAGFIGTRSFDYTVSDGGLTDDGRAIVTVTSCVPGIDTDNDRLDDCVETGTDVYVSTADTGTDPNDADTDDDGLDDGDEVLGTLAGLDLPGMGADPLRSDLFLEYDWFDDNLDSSVCAAHSHRPTVAMIERVEDAFADAPTTNPDGTTGIVVHQDYGQGGLFTGGNLINDLDGVLSGRLGTEFYDHKDTHFQANRDGYFHYAIFPHRYNRTSGSSGIAELFGDDFVVSLYCFNSTRNVANTIMHELGHNLGLRHGGDVNCNYKPNYNSVMNYLYQFPGVDDASCDSRGNGILDYSHGDRVDLVETNLDENEGVCGGISIDWDEDDLIESSVSEDVNPSGNSTCGGTLTTLEDHDDWAAIFYAGINDFDGASPVPVEVVACESQPAP